MGPEEDIKRAVRTSLWATPQSEALLERLWIAVEGVPLIRVISVLATFLGNAIHQGAPHDAATRDATAEATYGIIRKHLHAPLYAKKN